MLKQLNAISIGTTASHRISCCKTIGYISHIFDRAVNVESSRKEVISIVRKDLLNGPFNIVVDFPLSLSMRSLGITVGMEVKRSGSFLIIGERVLSLFLGEAKLWNPLEIIPERALPAKCIINNLSTIAQMIREKACSHGLARLIDYPEYDKFKEISTYSSSKIAESLCTHILELAEAIRKRDIKVVEEKADKIVGLGPGLTPTGDDILAGLMAGMIFVARYMGGHEEFVSEINNAIMRAVKNRKTTTISHEFLAHGAAGYVSEAVLNLVVAIFTGKRIAVMESTKKLLKFGYSSGMDTALGIRLGCRLGLNSSKQKIIVNQEL